MTENPFTNQAQIRLSVGRFSESHCDLDISFGSPENGQWRSWMAILPPDEAKELLKQLTYLMGRENDRTAVIPIRELHATIGEVGDSVSSWMWWGKGDGEGRNVGERYTCRCGVSEGQLHVFGCDYEMCSKCGERLYYECVCYDHGIYSLPPDDALLESITTTGRLPYILYPNHCVRCGELWPYMFMVPDSEWEYYVPKGHRQDMLCEQCYDEIVALVDKHHPRPDFPLTDWEKVNRPGRVIIG